MALFVFGSISTPQMMQLPPLKAKLVVTGASTESIIWFLVPSIISTVESSSGGKLRIYRRKDISLTIVTRRRHKNLVIWATPAATPLAIPIGLMVAIAEFALDQDTVARFWRLPSLNLPDAVNCCVSFTLTRVAAGMIAIDCNATAGCRDDEPPQPPVMMIASVAAKGPILLPKMTCRLSWNGSTTHLPLLE